MWSTSINRTIRLKRHRATTRASIWDNPHTPLGSCFLGEPAGVQKRRLSTAVWASNLAGVNKSSVIKFRDIKLWKDFGAVP